eukprot:scaffold227970_cov30-Tisochrysis_lutea.AAC.1
MVFYPKNVRKLGDSTVDYTDVWGSSSTYPNMVHENSQRFVEFEIPRAQEESECEGGRGLGRRHERRREGEGEEERRETWSGGGRCGTADRRGCG